MLPLETASSDQSLSVAEGAIEPGSVRGDGVRWPWEEDGWAGTSEPTQVASGQPADQADLLAKKESEAQQSWAALVETRRTLSTLRSELEAGLVREQYLRNRLRRLRQRHSEQRFVIRRLAEHADRIAAAERKAVEALTHAASMNEPPRKVRSVEEAVELADAQCVAVSVPDEVARAAAVSLDQSGRRRARGKAVLSALLALHTYATDASRRSDFMQWCRRGGSRGVSHPANQVAMGESMTVNRDHKMTIARTFPVDPALDVSGKRIMIAHIKLDQGPTAPRLYFFDDTRGNTGKVHIGYIGPHRPTASDPT